MTWDIHRNARLRRCSGCWLRTTQAFGACRRTSRSAPYDKRRTPGCQGRSRASRDNPFCAALFGTCKYRADWPANGFVTKDEAQAWVKSCSNLYIGAHLHSRTPLFPTTCATSGRTVIPSQTSPSFTQMPVPKTRTLVRKNPQLATRPTRPAQPGARNQRP